MARRLRERSGSGESLFESESEVPQPGRMPSAKRTPPAADLFGVGTGVDGEGVWAPSTVVVVVVVAEGGGVAGNGSSGDGGVVDDMLSGTASSAGSGAAGW